MMYQTHFNSLIGTLGITWESEIGKICRIRLPNETKTSSTSEIEATEKSSGTLPPLLKSVIQNLQGYFSGDKVDFLLDWLDYNNFTDFQLKVHRFVFQIPSGKTRTYSEVAMEIGSEGAARAVGNVMARNPYPIIIPCHRVVAQGGGLGGYRGGLGTKKFLLSFEQNKIM